MSQRDRNSPLEQWLHRVGAFDSPTFVLADHLHQLGFSILPLASRTERPARRWKRFQTERCDALDLVAWFVDNDFHPGIVTGAISGIVVVDCDQADVPDSARQFCSSTLTQQTKRGKHFVYRHPGYRCGNRPRINGDAVDIRGDGGYVAAYEEAEGWTADRIAQAPLYTEPQLCELGRHWVFETDQPTPAFESGFLDAATGSRYSGNAPRTQSNIEAATRRNTPARADRTASTVAS